MSGICQRECENKTELGYCKTTWCIKPLHLNEILATNLQLTCNKTDLIRRQGAIDAIKKSAMYIPEASTELYMALLAIENLPSAQTERKKGKWIEYPEALRYDKALYETSIVCSCCKSVWDILENETQDFDFCPSCGADMRGEQDDND